MKLNVNDEFKEILKKIKSENKTLEEWCEIESSDMFQSKSFNGGFDADEGEFCFSYYDLNDREFWFQFPLSEVDKALNDSGFEFDVTEADY